MTALTNEELAQGWLNALGDVETFRPLCEPDAKVWHSNDDVWMTLDAAIGNVHLAGGIPPREREAYRLTADGFLVQFTVSLGGQRMHNTILVRVRDGLAYEIEEYIGLETDLAALIASQIAAQA
ncbi:nuclear transport factor 2 family protein [Microbacterium sp. No. 7]|uniref:nuclear transport factor 2 family protein n=1 Tax=Microbacterium sp. No. 7 TaxID=1714373 RepID=UPI0006CFC0C2|nr:hypothetical protein [Microbacterium sp. No. 7]ALJ19590.1 hypothetical protein AOA12_06570 [Microbacterium sp. No. 7]